MNSICWIIESVYAKNLEVALLLVDFSKAFDFMQRKMKHISSKETVTSIMILYKNMKAMVYSPSSDTDFLVIGALVGDTLVLYL